MTDRVEDGGAAFPCEQGHTPDGTWNQSFDPGMTLRDWFAGQALAGYFAAPNTNHRNTVHDQTAEYMYAIADAMISARSRQMGLNVGGEA